MHHRFFRAALMAVAAVGVASAVHAQQPAPAPQAADPVVARVNGEEILRSDVMTRLSQLPAHIQQMPMETIFPALVDQLINEKVIGEAGYKAKLQDTPEVKRDVRRAEERAVQRAYIQGQIKARVTPEMIEQAYKDKLAKTPAQDEVKASHILVATEAEAKGIIAELKKGGDFAKIARERSKDTGAAAQGGDLGFFTKDTMVEPFAKAAFAMKPGEISQTPVETQFGWHVIKVEERRSQPQPTRDELMPQIEQELTQEIVGSIIGELRGTAKVEDLSAPAPTLAPAK